MGRARGVGRVGVSDRESCGVRGVGGQGVRCPELGVWGGLLGVGGSEREAHWMPGGWRSGSGVEGLWGWGP